MPARFSRAYLLHYGICPIELSGGAAVFASVSEPDPHLVDDLAFSVGRSISIKLVDDLELARLIDAHTEGEQPQVPDGGQGGEDLRNLANQPTVVRFVSLVVRDAIQRRASDVHVELSDDALGIRYRIDGVLTPGPRAPTGIGAAVISRLRIMADLDIAERRQPQDGRIRLRLPDRTIDARVSIVPSEGGESAVLRLLDSGSDRISLEQLGMDKTALEHVRHWCGISSGLILVTGPTGSGKTTTLYAALSARSAATEKVVTIEDPVEYRLPLVTQLPVNATGGLAFGNALRSVLRHDPDVILVGEIRDADTASVAVQAAMTGHLVFSSVHTNDALSAIPRLRDLGVPSFLIAATLRSVVAQRLIRVSCPHCGGVPGRECTDCRGTGFDGRTGLYEVVDINDRLRQAIAADCSTDDLLSIARAHGFQSMREVGQQLVDDGKTTMSELMRATHDR